MRASLLSLALVLSFARGALGEGGREMTLTLPHPLHEGETASLEVQLGALARGQEVSISTTSGQSLGTISPYGVRSGQDAGTYTVPLPPDAIAGDRVSLRLTLGNEQRAPTAEEVKSVRVKIGGAAR